MSKNKGSAEVYVPGVSHNIFFPIAIAFFVGLDYFDNSLFSFFASYIAGGVNASADELVWSTSCYAVASVLGILQQSWLVHRIGYRYYLVSCLLGFSLAGIGVCLSESSGELALARALQGYCIGPMLSVCRILIQNSFAGKERGFALRLFLFFILLASASAPLIGGYLIAHMGWQSPFAVTSGVGALLVLMAFIVVPEHGKTRKEEHGEAHFLPYIIFAVAFSALQISMQQIAFEQYFSTPVLPSLTVIGLLALLWFARHQWYHPRPLIKLQTFTADIFRTGLVMYMFFYFISNSLGFLISRMLEGGLGYPVQNAGSLVGYTSLLAVSFMFVYFRYSPLVKNKKWLIVPGCLTSALICVWLMKMPSDVSEGWLFLPLLLRGVLLLTIALPVGGRTFSLFDEDEYSHSYRIKNILKQLTFSFSTASIIMIEQHRSALHYSRLAENITWDNPAFQQMLTSLANRFSTTSSEIGNVTALEYIQRIVIQQSDLLSIQDGFLYLTIVSIAAAVFSLWQKRI